MKEKYYSPDIKTDILEKTDVLLDSASSSTTEASSSTVKKREIENVYRDFATFNIGNDWF